MIVDATRIVTTQGQYAGEEGVGYQWGRGEMGDFSHETLGRIQGYREPCRIEVLVGDVEMGDLEEYGLLCWAGSNESFTADEALAHSYARVVAEEPGG